MPFSRSLASKKREATYQALVVAYLLVLTGALVLAGVHTMRWLQLPFLGAIVEPTGYFSDLGPLVPGTWSAKAQGLGFPDRLLLVEGRAYDGPGALEHLLRGFQPGQWVVLLVERTSQPREAFALPLQRFPAQDRWLYFYAPYLLGWIYLLTAWWVLLSRPREARARWFGAGVGSAGFVLGGLLNALAVHWWAWMWALALGVSGGCLLGLALAFLRSEASPSWLLWLEKGVLALGIGLGLWGSVTIENMRQPLAYVQALRASYAYLALAILVYLGVNLRLRLKARSPLMRERAGLILLSALFAFGPLLGWALASALGIRQAFSPLWLFPLGLFPLGTAYAMLRYRWFYVEALFERGGVYALLMFLGFLGYALVVAGLSMALGARWLPQHPWWVGLFAFVLALALDPFRRRLQNLVDQVFARQQHRYRERLESFGQALIQAATETQIWELLRAYVAADLHSEPIHLFVRDPLTGDYRPASDAQGETSSDVRFRGDSPFVQFLSRVEPVYYFGAEERLPASVQAEGPRIALLQAVLFVPLPGQEEGLVGFLALGTRRGGALYLRSEIAYLQGLARQAALALERSRAATNLSRRVAQLNTLMRVAQGINAVPDLESLLELVAAQTRRLLPASWLQIVLWDARRECYFRALVQRGEERLREKEQQPLGEEEGLVWWVLRERRAYRTERYEQTCRLQGVFPEEPGLLAWMGAPLIAEEGLVGALTVGHHHWEVRYTEEHQELLQTMADLAVGALIKTRLIRQNEQRARQLAALNEMGRAITSTLDLQELQERLLTSARALLEAQAARLWLVEPGTQQWVLAAVQGMAEDEEEPPRWVQMAAERQRPLCWPPQQVAVAELVGAQPPVPQINTALVVPLLAQEKIVGALELFDKQDGSRFTLEEGQLLLALAGQAAVAIENARLYAQTDEALAARVEELTAMEFIDRELNASLDLARAMRVTLDWAMRRTHSDAGMIGVLQEDRIRILAEEGFGSALAPYREQGLPLAWEGIRRAVEASTLQRLSLEQEPAGFALREDTQAQVSIPILREGRVLAVLVLESRSPKAYSEDDLRFLTRLVEHAAIAITNAQLYAAVQEANRTKSEFVSFVAHELKTPMTSIRGYTDLLRSGVVGPINQNQRNFLEIIRANVERMVALVSDLADISRIEAGQLRLNFQRVAVPKVVKEVVSSLQAQIEAKKQRLFLEVPDTLPDVWADPVRLAQILTNLISNAHKYTPEGGEIRVSAEATENRWDPSGPPKVVHIAVQDTGLGIHPEEQKRIFQRFFRSEADQDAREQPGTGLGLYITKNLVEMQGGRIWFESVYRQGTTFHFTIPIATAMEEAPSAHRAEPGTGA